jgi:hypothetical protein
MSKDWKNLAAALDPPIPETDVEKIAPVLDALESAFRPLQAQIPASTPTWTGPVPHTGESE